ncbi:type II toxin-antitoxin system mRNA interferase toxin, RelE/StbE family [Candidatus Peregrinibacteria bacterium]|nr:type II toxin-antitoxin system mRNA interferase toxin, RelE/StbE family [Candidatus Peregrinibacteria bacterium]
MLKADYHRDFKKDFKKLHPQEKERFQKKFLTFLQNPQNPELRDHALKGLLRGKRSFSITGDVRVIYRYLDKNSIILLRIGTHNQVY